MDAPVFEIRPTDLDGVSIKVIVIDEGSITPLSFGKNGDLDTIFINVEDSSIIGWVLSKQNFQNRYSAKIRDRLLTLKVTYFQMLTFSKSISFHQASKGSTLEKLSKWVSAAFDNEKIE